ncbi:two-component system, chemotaxis family, CheB/CheR fusion protein [Aromatoleum tolulyticum]|uniref:Two-component system, chemotaxis family, CheB/CheR fusion protein n=1 Tax=Aromatoleum tolulyticum TaxID=34027 RepID=A0A1N6XZB9_9RHOO|nr:chemotaxis protein CheB [Aromatoleum tolulyticum]SIR07571.1 two-component system, chemotaxis family, CheB/CheR fusion protein [Aromatoleum tolulyticum]
MAEQESDIHASAGLPKSPKSPRAAGAEVFPIVGIGASAGGLEALEQFLSRVPADSGMAYVIVQHLDPTHKGMMPDLLQRATAMPVVQARNRLKVKPDHVYVIPPNRDMSMLRGALYLFEPAAPRGLRLPIDFFLKSLAEDRHQLAVGVILSGMGSDGSAGMRAIKENAGLALAQDPATAAFSAMPRSAIDAGLIDIVAPAAELPARILASLRHGAHAAAAEPVVDNQLQSGLEKVLILLRAHNGQDFSLYKKTTLYRRIERRMGIHQIDRIATYVRFLQENPQELELLFREFLIGVTSFFRDPAAWDSLRDAALPPLFARGSESRVLRAWVPGCSTGEEAYSLAIVFKESMEKFKPGGRFSLHIFATDLDSDAIDRARQGRYPANIAADIPPERLARFFVASDDGYQVCKEIREMVVFAPQNLIQDPPFTKLDLLLCRNVLIYFSAELQKKLLPLFHYSLTPGGVLFLGNSEALGVASDLFAPIDAKARIFRRIDMPAQAVDIDFPARFRSLPAWEGEARVSPPPANLQGLADQLLLRQFAPAAVLVNDRGDIVYINGRTGRYLEPAAGKANWNIYAMAREGLRAEIGSALYQVTRNRGRVERTDIRVSDDGITRRVGLVVQLVEEPEPLRGMVMIVFAELPPLPETRKGGRRAPNSARQAELERELQQARDEIHTLREEMQTSQEELKSANEELQSTNEELQSTNEELTTSKEEMQSLNEELQTVNIELQSKVDDLSSANNDMQNLLNSTEIATVFLDCRLHVRRFTPLATRVIKLIAADAGRPLSDLATDLDYPALEDDAREVLRTLMFSEKQIATRDGRWFTVRIMPYRTMDNVIEGVVITFIDISVAKRLEAELRAAVAGGLKVTRAQGAGA